MLQPTKLDDQFYKFPTTRYMGSKNKLIEYIWAATEGLEFDSVLDLFSGSGVVSYMYKSQGKKVISNDYMAMSAVMTKALIENNRTLLSKEEALALIEEPEEIDSFVQNTFNGIYYSNQDNKFIDIVRTNIKGMENEYKKAIALEALIRSCVKKRPRGIFTYVGDRYNDGRKDLQKSFKDHFLDAVEDINKAVFSNKKRNKSLNSNFIDVNAKADLVYIDPPYYTPKSDNEYVRRYHFVEGIARDWQGVEIQEHEELYQELIGEFGEWGTIDRVDDITVEQLETVVISGQSITLVFDVTFSTQTYSDHEYYDNGSQECYVKIVGHIEEKFIIDKSDYIGTTVGFRNFKFD